MLKKFWMTIGVIGVVTVLGFGVYHSNASQADPTLTPENIKELVQAQYPGTITELQLDKDASGSVYEVEVTNDGVEYELKIDGQSGEVINLKEKLVAAKERAGTKEVIDLKEKEKEQKEEEKQAAKEKEEQEKQAKEKEEKEKQEKAKADEQAQVKKEKKEKEKQTKKKEKKKKQEKAKANEEAQQKTQVKKNESSSANEDEKQKEKETKSTNTVIDVNKAIDIALAKFPGTVDEVELDEEDGRLVYEIEIEGNGEEAEFEIDAYTGEIIVIEIEED